MQIVMSRKELDRVELIVSVVSGDLSQGEAASLMNLSPRQVRRLVRRFERSGAEGLAHRSRGKPSNRGIAESVRAEVVEFMKDAQFEDYGPTLLSEAVAEERGIIISRETMRQWMIAENRWTPRKAKVHHRQWRERKACYGQMVQMDTSIHDWLEGRGDTVVLIAIIDDATSDLFCRFFPTDSTATNMTLLRDYIRRHGRPRSLYVDKASHFMTSRPATPDEQRAGKQAQTQIQRALEELDIEHITAHSPQAKGRVERLFKTLQDRLVKGMRRAQITTLEQANDYLEKVFLPMWKHRFTCEPREAANAHCSHKGFNLNAIFSRQDVRHVADDYTFSLNGQRFQIQKRSIRAGLRRSKVIIEQRLDGSFRVRWRGRYLRVTPLPEHEAKTKPKPPRPKADLKQPKTKPGPDHPWRRRKLPLAAAPSATTRK